MTNNPGEEEDAHVSFQMQPSPSPQPGQRESSRTSSTHSSPGQQLRRRRPPKLRDVTKMVMRMSSKRNLMSADEASDDGSQMSSTRSIRRGSMTLNSPAHRRIYSASTLPYQGGNISSASSTGTGADNNTPLENTAIPMFASDTTSGASFLDHAQHLENLFQMGPADTFQDLRRNPSMGRVEEVDDEEDDVVIEWQRDNNTAAATEDVEQGNTATEEPQETTNLLKTPSGIPRAVRTRFRCWNNFLLIVPPDEIWSNLKTYLSTTVAFFMLPCTVAAAVFYYPLENPNLEFLPSQARLSWFLLFAVRQSVTLTLAQMSQWILQMLTMRTTLLARIAGPLPALVAMQSNGWPFLLSAWGCWNLLLLHGDSPFVKHWLYWSGIRLFSIQYNTGDGFLGSDLYGRILVAMIVLGVASATKRTFVALYLSRRMLQYYRHHLGEVMSQVKWIMEVAELAAQTEQPGFDQLLKENVSQLAMERKNNNSRFVETVPTFENTKDAKKGKGKGSKEKKDVEVVMEDDDVDDDDDDSVMSAEKDLQHAMGESTPEVVDPKVQWQLLKQRAVNDRDTVNFGGDYAHSGSRHNSPTSTAAAKTAGLGHHHRAAMSMSNRSMSASMGMGTIFPFLERWHEPQDKGKKNIAPNLHDILQFKKAIVFMETNFPFSPAYGSCVNRKACVKNAVRVYRRLLRFTPDQNLLNFDVIGSLAYEQDGELDEDRAIALLRIFYPDKDDHLPMLAFVQACDNVYKHLRFLRASLSNSSKIDGVLEDIFDVVFYCILAVLISCLCGFNPWPLLISFSTLTVSFAFAFGSSVAKGLEGILMIAVRRPYDIGDRITISGAEAVATPAMADSWLVEDITLTATTLRFAGTNEVATINNASLANSRIVNCERSPKAMVTIILKFDVDATQRQLDDFRYKMEAYLENRPRVWIGLIHYRVQAVDSDAGYVTIVYKAQHVKSWQECGPIWIHQGEWTRYADTVATEMGIVFDSPPRQMTVGLGIAPESQNNKSIDDRRQVADFVRSISGRSRPSSTEGQAKSSDEKVFGAISEYSDSGHPAATKEVEAPDTSGTR